MQSACARFSPTGHFRLLATGIRRIHSHPWHLSVCRIKFRLSSPRQTLTVRLQRYNTLKQWELFHILSRQLEAPAPSSQTLWALSVAGPQACEAAAGATTAAAAAKGFSSFRTATKKGKLLRNTTGQGRGTALEGESEGPPLSDNSSPEGSINTVDSHLKLRAAAASPSAAQSPPLSKHPNAGSVSALEAVGCTVESAAAILEAARQEVTAENVSGTALELVRLGLAARDVASVLATCPALLTVDVTDLHSRADRLLQELGDRRKIAAAVAAVMPALLTSDQVWDSLQHWLACLRDWSVPLKRLPLLLTRCPTLLQGNPEHLRSNFRLAESIGISSQDLGRLLVRDPTSVLAFGHRYETLMALLHGHGLSNDSTQAILRRLPQLLELRATVSGVLAELQAAGLEGAELQAVLRTEPRVLLKHPGHIRLKVWYLTSYLALPVTVVSDNPHCLLQPLGLIGPRCSFIKTRRPEVLQHWSIHYLLSRTDDHFCKLVSVLREEYVVYNAQWLRTTGEDLGIQVQHEPQRTKRKAARPANVAEDGLGIVGPQHEADASARGVQKPPPPDQSPPARRGRHRSARGVRLKAAPQSVVVARRLRPQTGLPRVPPSVG